jgi:hypothetical protein
MAFVESFFELVDLPGQRAVQRAVGVPERQNGPGQEESEADQDVT